MTTINTPNKIPDTDHRYELLKAIPMKEFEDDHSYLYLRINDEKDYFIVSIDAKIQTQLLWYSPNDDDNRIVRLWAHVHVIPTDGIEDNEEPYQTELDASLNESESNFAHIQYPDDDDDDDDYDDDYDDDDDDDCKKRRRQ